MPEFVIGRVVGLGNGQSAVQRLPTVTPAKAARMAALVTAARQYKAVLADGEDDRLIDVATENLLAAALAIE